VNVSKCGKGIFQIESLEPYGSDSSVISVICHNCYIVVGTIPNSEYYEKIQNQIEIVENKLETINQNLEKIMNVIKVLYSKVDDISKSKNGE